MSMGGGSGGTSQQSNTFSPPLWTLNQWPDFVQGATNLATAPQQHYYGQKIAGINNTQAQGMQYLSDLYGNNSPDMAAARRNLQLTASGSYENPYASVQTLVPDNPYLGQNADYGTNDFIGQRAQAQPNAFAGMSPAYHQMKDSAMGDVVKQYQTAIAPQTDAAFNHAGAFHAGGHDAAIAANQYALAQNLGRMSNEMDVGQWNRSGDLNQQYLNNDLQSSLAENARQQSGQQNWLNYATGAQQQNLDRNSGLAQAGIGMGVQAQQGDLSRASGAWNDERNRQMGAFGSILQGNQFDQHNAQGMIGLGDIQRGYTQDLLNSQFGDWQNTSNYPQQMMDMYANALARASGNYGQNMSQSQQMYQANPFASAVGLGALGGAAYNAWGG